MTLIIELWAPCRGGGLPHTLKSANQCPAPNPAGRFAVPATPKAGRRAGRALRRPDRPPGARPDVTSPSPRPRLNWNRLLHSAGPPPPLTRFLSLPPPVLVSP